MKITNFGRISFIILIVIIIFLPSLKNDFAWDDKYLIIENPYIKDWGYAPKIFRTQLYEGAGESSDFYRPLQLISFVIDYSVWKLNPFGYHLTSLLLHALNTAFVYLIGLAITSSVPIAFLAALMFGISPVISGVTYYIPARADLLMALFLLLSVFFFIRYKEKKQGVFYAGSIISFGLSLLSKEMAIVLPFLLLLIDACLPPRRWKGILPYIAILLVYFGLRLSILNFLKGPNLFIDYTFPASIPICKRMLTDLNVIAVYLKLLLFPYNLHMQRFIKPADGLFEINVIIPALFIISLLFIIKKLSQSDRIFLYPVYWFFICLAPVLNIYAISVFLHEMWLYLPSAGFYIFFSAFIVKFMARKMKNMHVILFIMLYMAYYCITTISYGKTWKDSISLFDNDLKYASISPFEYCGYNNLGVAYYNKGDVKKSIECFKKAASLEHRYPGLYNNLGISYMALKRPVRAIFFFKKTIQLDRVYAEAYSNLGYAYNSIGLQERAIEASNAAIKIDPGSYMAYRNIGFIYSEKKDVDRAIEFFLKAEKISKDDYTLIDCLARLYMKKGDYKKALSEYEKALRLNVQDFMFYNGLASAYISNHKFKEAEKALLYSLALNSRQWMAHNRLGNLYSMLGYFELALGEYAKALNIDPHNKGILDNIEKIKKIF